MLTSFLVHCGMISEFWMNPQPGASSTAPQGVALVSIARAQTIGCRLVVPTRERAACFWLRQMAPILAATRSGATWRLIKRLNYYQLTHFFFFLFIFVSYTMLINTFLLKIKKIVQTCRIYDQIMFAYFASHLLENNVVVLSLCCCFKWFNFIMLLNAMPTTLLVLCFVDSTIPT